MMGDVYMQPCPHTKKNAPAGVLGAAVARHREVDGGVEVDDAVRDAHAQDVERLEVAVHHALAVQVRHRLEQRRERQPYLRCHASAEGKVESCVNGEVQRGYKVAP